MNTSFFNDFDADLKSSSKPCSCHVSLLIRNFKSIRSGEVFNDVFTDNGQKFGRVCLLKLWGVKAGAGLTDDCLRLVSNVQRLPLFLSPAEIRSTCRRNREPSWIFFRTNRQHPADFAADAIKRSNTKRNDVRARASWRSCRETYEVQYH